MGMLAELHHLAHCGACLRVLSTGVQASIRFPLAPGKVGPLAYSAEGVIESRVYRLRNTFLQNDTFTSTHAIRCLRQQEHVFGRAECVDVEANDPFTFAHMTRGLGH